MTGKQPKILVVGSRTVFQPLFAHLEACGRYRLDYATDLAAASLLQPRPNLVFLLVPVEKRAKEQALVWLRAVNSHVPVVVLSPEADLYLYLACMTSSAFDYLTGYNRPGEIVRVLDNAIRSVQRAAA